jgi:hypothetical protein
MSTNLRATPMQDLIARKQAAFNAAFDALAKGKFSDKTLAAQVVALFGQINAPGFPAADRIS